MSEPSKIPEPSNGGSDQHLVRLILLSRRVVETSDEPECGCEYQHERCAAMAYRNAVRELESFIKEIELNADADLPPPAMPESKESQPGG